VGKLLNALKCYNNQEYKLTEIELAENSLSIASVTPEILVTDWFPAQKN